MVTTADSPGQTAQNVKFLNHLEEFFLIATPLQHIQLIDYWVEMILTDQFYARHNAPCDLLLRHRLFSSLIEQIFHIMEHAHIDIGRVPDGQDLNEYIERERNELSYYPVYLDSEQLRNPALIFTEVVEIGGLKQFQTWLDEWLVEGLNGNRNIEADVSIFPLYRIMKQLIEACWLMYSRETREPAEDSALFHELQPLISFITTIIPTAYIFCLTYKNGWIDLMVVLNKDSRRSFIEMEPLLEFAALGHPKVICTLHTLDVLQDLLSNGRLYYLRVCMEENCVYHNRDAAPLPVFNTRMLQDVENAARPPFNDGLRRARTFYQGASNFLRLDETTLATSLLRQSCELSYRTLILVLNGKEINADDLTVLRKHLRRYYPPIIGVFSDNEEEELRLLHVLDRAFQEARSAHHFEITDEDVAALHTGTWRLLEVMKGVFGEEGGNIA